MKFTDEPLSTPKTTPKFERLKWRLAAGYFAYFMCGWGDGVTGTVLPYFMHEFKISFMMSSLLYAGGTIGFMIGTSVVESIINYLGTFHLERTTWSWLPNIPFLPPSPEKSGFSASQARLLSLLVSSFLHGMFFVMMGFKGGFWTSFSAYGLAAFARSTLTASLNAYFAAVKPASMGYAFGSWSFGGVASPLVCQAIIATGVPWFQFYFGSLVLSAFNIAFLVITFQPTTVEFMHDRETALCQIKRLSDDSYAPDVPTPLSLIGDTECMRLSDGDKKNLDPRFTLRLALSLPYQWAVCVFAVLYCGCETATQSFMVSYLLHTRNANPKTVGYVTSGFWGGITVGRLAWGFYISKLTYLQRKLVIQGCLILGLTMELLIWFVNSNVQNAFSTAIIGLVYGPLFPACLTLANDILPSEIRLVSMAMICAGGSLGAAIFPFVAGTISSSRGVQTLTYLTVPLAGTLAIFWALFPSKISARGTAA